jgi:hypothetical protein
MSKDKLVWNYIILSVIVVLLFILVYINFFTYKEEEIQENLSLCRYGTCDNISYDEVRANFTTGFTEFNDESKRDEKLISYISNPPYN